MDDHPILGNEAMQRFERVVAEAQRVGVDVRPYDVPAPTLADQMALLQLIRAYEDSRVVHLR